MLRCLLILSALAACVTPYQERGLLGGYTDQRVGPNQYLISVRVNAYTAHDTALEYFYQRAAELCPTGYTVTDRDATAVTGLVTCR